MGRGASGGLVGSPSVVEASAFLITKATANCVTVLQQILSQDPQG
jgi:hypothetical protein